MPLDRSVESIVRTKTASEWTTEDPFLSRRDLCIESDTGRMKVGEGALWSATGYKIDPAGLPSTARVQVQTFSATVVANALLYDIINCTLTGATQIQAPTGGVDGQTIRWRITQDATGSRAVTMVAGLVIPASGSDPLPWSTAAGATDTLAATYHASLDRWDVVAFVPGQGV